MRKTAVAISILIAIAGTIAAQSTALDAKSRADVIESLSRELNRTYVFADKAVIMERDLRENLRSGAYDAITEPATFARTLTTDLQRLTHDKHLRIGHSSVAPGGTNGSGSGRPAAFGESKRLPGNVAYVEIKSFGFPAEDVRDEVKAIMSAAADASALIIDLRANGGGNPAMVALVSSYVFGDEPVHLNSLYWRARNRTDDFFTDPKVGGTKFGPSKPVYVLTSRRTFSAAEEFTYNLQARKRATIVGDTTGGGAHPGGMISLPHGFRAFIPSGRAINPITRTNWEGTGIIPNVPVPADSALEAALRLARRAAM